MTERTYAVNDSIGWDDRKALADLWQEHSVLPEGGLTDATYAALLAVAAWGAGRMYDNYVDTGAAASMRDAIERMAREPARVRLPAELRSLAAEQ